MSKIKIYTKGVKKLDDKFISHVQPDWREVRQGEKNYIANKPFGPYLNYLGSSQVEQLGGVIGIIFFPDELQGKRFALDIAGNYVEFTFDFLTDGTPRAELYLQGGSFMEITPSLDYGLPYFQIFVAEDEK